MFAYPDIHTRGVGRILLSYVSNSPNPSLVYIRLCKHRKRLHSWIANQNTGYASSCPLVRHLAVTLFRSSPASNAQRDWADLEQRLCSIGLYSFHKKNEGWISKCMLLLSGGVSGEAQKFGYINFQRYKMYFIQPICSCFTKFSPITELYNVIYYL